MAKVFDGIDEKMRDWIERQHLFFVATAPGEGGHVNCSPKGGDSLRILDRYRVAYFDQLGSGVETISHLRDNGRIVIMFCAFEGPPRIVRLHGIGEAIQRRATGFDALLDQFEPLAPMRLAAARSIIRVTVDRVSDSCGYGVPRMRYEGERTQFDAWAENRLRHNGPHALIQYQAEENLASIDGLPGLDPALVSSS